MPDLIKLITELFFFEEMDAGTSYEGTTLIRGQANGFTEILQDARVLDAYGRADATSPLLDCTREAYHEVALEAGTAKDPHLSR
jgi:hypothetical protein